MRLAFTLEFPYLPQLVNVNGKKHWAVQYRHARLWHKRIIDQCVIQRVFNLQLTKAHLVLVRRSARQPDGDNLAASFKPLIDGLVKAYVLVDDNPDVIGMPTFKWEKAGLKKGGVRLEVYDCRDNTGTVSQPEGSPAEKCGAV